MSTRLAQMTRLAGVVTTGLLIAAIVIVVGMSVYLTQELTAFVEEPADQVQWNITQLELDAMRLQTEAEIASLSPTRPLEELRRRYDLFYSRAQSVILGRTFDNLDMARQIAEMDGRLQLFLLATTPRIDRGDADLRAELPQLVAQTAALREYLRSMSVEIVQQVSRLDDARRHSFASLVWAVLGLGMMVICTLILMLYYVQWMNRVAGRRAAETDSVSSRLVATVASALDAIIVTDPQGRIIDYNPAAEQIFGHSRARAIGADFSLLVDPGQMQALHQAKRSGLVWPEDVADSRVEITARKQDGTTFPAEATVVSVPSEDGSICIIYLRDISSRRLVESSLLAARDSALAADQAKTNFLAVMSHEMRTPLNGVLASLEILADMMRDPDQQRFLSLAQSSASQLLRHLNDVLEISKVDSGKVKLTQEVLDLDRLVSDLVATFQTAAARRETVLKTRFLSALPPVLGDGLRLSQVLQNLLSNALKFTKAGHVTVEVELTDRQGDDVNVEFRVEDTGIGVSESDQARIFDEFVMLDPSYRRSEDGTGLGLAISRRLVRALGGEIGVESEPGVGSCFWFRIPFHLAGGMAASEHHALAATPSRPLEILLVEDNPINQTVIQVMLERLGHRASLAADGQQGLDLAQSRRFDVILMDLSMPRMDGLTATRGIRAGGPSAHSRILALTAHSLPEDIERCMAAGMDGCLTKPVSRGDLERALMRTAPPTLPPAASDSPIDRDRLDELEQTLGPDRRRILLQDFLTDLARLTDGLSAALAAGDTGSAMKLAHEAAGSSGMMGARALHRVLVQMESQCRSGDHLGAVALADAELATTLTALRADLETLVA